MKRILKITLLLAVAVLGGYNAYQSNSETENMSDTMLANVEALASGEKDVTCQYDPGDTCMVGNTPVSDWDEKTSIWL